MMDALEWAREQLARAEAAEAERVEARKAAAIDGIVSRRVRTERAFAEMLEAMDEASDAGVPVRVICEKAGISRQTFYKWVKAGDAPATPFGSRGPKVTN